MDPRKGELKMEVRILTMIFVLKKKFLSMEGHECPNGSLNNEF